MSQNKTPHFGAKVRTFGHVEVGKKTVRGEGQILEGVGNNRYKIRLTNAKGTITLHMSEFELL